MCIRYFTSYKEFDRFLPFNRYATSIQNPTRSRYDWWIKMDARASWYDLLHGRRHFVFLCVFPSKNVLQNICRILQFFWCLLQKLQKNCRPNNRSAENLRNILNLNLQYPKSAD